MKIGKFQDANHQTWTGVQVEDQVYPIRESGTAISLTSLLEKTSEESRKLCEAALKGASVAVSSLTVLAPIDGQEVWGAGVTYLRSKQAREEESERAATFYDQIYVADRPELFFKATPNRVVGPETPIRARSDSRWTVPEPELALVLNSSLSLVGYTIGNDVSARDIEGRNPLYLPQAKVYDACCGLGPVIVLTDNYQGLEALELHLKILRGGQTIVQSSTSVGQMKRKLSELVDWLGRDSSFPSGVILLTGTGIVPPDNFTLEQGDIVEIECPGLGVLRNPVVIGTGASA